MLEYLKTIDTQIFFFVNGAHNSFFDFIFWWISNKWTWIPLYAFLLYIIIKHYRNEAIVTCLLIIVLITVSDQLSSSVIKNVVMRLRPCHDPAIATQVHLVNGYCGGQFGFVSSHASNSFALLTFLSVYFKSQHYFIKRILVVWALLVCYSRIYLGAHYPGDVFCGALLGTILGVTFISALLFIIRPQLNAAPKNNL